MPVALRGVDFTLIDAGSINVGAGQHPITCPVVADNHVITVKGSGAIASGTVLIEEANREDYTGAWSLIATVDASTLTGGKALVTPVARRMQACRARISVIIVGGGSVEAIYNAY